MRCGITGSKGVLGNRLSKFKDLKFIKFNGDITNKKEVDNWIRKNRFDIFIHLAAIVPVDQVNKNYSYAKMVNYNGTINIIKSLIKYQNFNLKWFFFPSTSHVYLPNKKNKIKEHDKIKPISKYGKTKWFAEKFISKIKNKANFRICIGRIFSFTDRKQKTPFLIPSLKKKINSKNKKILLENMFHYRDFISIKDLCRAIIFLSKKNYNGIINIGTGKKTFIKDIALNIRGRKTIYFKKNLKITYLIANNSKLKKLGFQFKYNSIKDILN